MARKEQQLSLLKVNETESHEPRSILRHGQWNRVEEVIARWRLHQEWWKRPVERDYFRVRLSSGTICEVFRDAQSGCWRLYRVYD